MQGRSCMQKTGMKQRCVVGSVCVRSSQDSAAVPQATLSVQDRRQYFSLPKEEAEEDSAELLPPPYSALQMQRPQPCNRASKIMPLLTTFPAISYEGTVTNSGVKAQLLCHSVLISSLILRRIKLPKDQDGQPHSKQASRLEGLGIGQCIFSSFRLREYKTYMPTQRR